VNSVFGYFEALTTFPEEENALALESNPRDNEETLKMVNTFLTVCSTALGKRKTLIHSQNP
jgi:hypothetical protein